jgi:hypothetical protein
MAWRAFVPKIRDCAVTFIAATRQRARTLEFWVEWISTIVLIAGVLLTSLNVYPANLVLGFLGNIGWLALSFFWGKWSLICVQAIILAIYFGGLAANYLGGGAPLAKMAAGT